MKEIVASTTARVWAAAGVDVDPSEGMSCVFLRTMVSDLPANRPPSVYVLFRWTHAAGLQARTSDASEISGLDARGRTGARDCDRDWRGLVRPGGEDHRTHNPAA